MGKYPFNKTEQKWRKKWEETNLYKSDLYNEDKEKMYTLVMFSYPSGSKIHMGHMYNYCPTDTWARMKRMQGYNVFEPMGFDAFGLPAENYAVKTGIHPKESTMENIDAIREQLKKIGAMYDWDHEVITSEPDYYKWTQWMFTQLYKNDLAYKKKAPVNWCPSCNTVLANEQVVDGLCERCDSQVEQKELSQWFFKTTEYADKLLENLDDLDWPKRTADMQKNWIGKSKGAEIDFQIKNHDKEFTVFTTRPDTLFGVTYVVMAPEHPYLDEIVKDKYKNEVEEYKRKAMASSELDRLSDEKKKTGVFTGEYAINPVNGEEVPIWVSDYVLMSYGTGVVMAVPAHDERDFEFANKFDLPIRQVIKPEDKEAGKLEEAYVDNGIMVNSEDYNGMSSKEFKKKIIEVMEENNFGKATINYKIRDWLISRQRYWGAPIPVVYCEDCGEVIVPEEDLPVKLPMNVDFDPTGESPLAEHPDFKYTKCPKCGKDAIRECDTMDTFVDSSWYFLRYLNPNDKEKPFEKKLANRWLPVDQYVGGAEHAVMHLMYARFFTMALNDMGLINFEEPFKRLIHQGIILGPDGKKMSKSKGNVINPDKYIDEFGADVLRVYLMFAYDYETGGAWDDDTLKATNRFLNRVWRFITEDEWAASIFSDEKFVYNETDMSKKWNKDIERKLHKTIKEVTEDTNDFKFNTAISKIMELTNKLYKYVQKLNFENQNKKLLRVTIENLVKLLAPFAPHMCEELWEIMGNEYSIFDKNWPEYDENKLVADTVVIAAQINGKVRDEISVPVDAKKEEIKEKALDSERVQKYIENKEIIKVIVVPGRIINFVVK